LCGEVQIRWKPLDGIGGLTRESVVDWKWCEMVFGQLIRYCVVLLLHLDYKKWLRIRVIYSLHFLIYTF
jgi:hypothetical protein